MGGEVLQVGSRYRKGHWLKARVSRHLISIGKIFPRIPKCTLKEFLIRIRLSM